MMKSLISLVAMLSLFLFHLRGEVIEIGKVRIINESDTVKLREVLDHVQGMDMVPKLMAIMEQFYGVPYGEGTLEIEPEKIVLRTDSFDSRTFIENVLAIREATYRSTPDWRNVASVLENMRYRNAEVNGFPSRLLYMSEWIASSVSAHRLRDITSDVGDPSYVTKALDYITENRDSYSQLADSLAFDRMKQIEMGMRSVKIPYLSKSAVTNKKALEELRTGDILLFLSKEKNRDYEHVAFIEVKDGEIYLIHASKEEGKVCRKEQTLRDYVRHEGRTIPGFRVMRIIN